MRHGATLLFVWVNFASISAIVGAAPAIASDTAVMRVGNVLGDPEPGQEPHHMVRTQRYFAKLVWEKTGGSVEVRFLEGKSLPTFQMPAMVGKGEIEATNVPGFFFTKVPELGVQTIPYLFEGLEHARRFPRSRAADYLAAKIEDAYGVHVVSFLKIASSASINSLEPIRLPEDFEGKKIANIWDLYETMYEEYPPAHLRGVGYSESVEGGLVSGEFDVAIGQLQNNHFQKLYEYFKHQTTAPWLYNIYYTFVVNTEFWDSLTPEQHIAIDEAAREAEGAAITFAEQAAQRHFELMAEEGVSMHRQTKREREAWKAAFEKLVVDAVVASTEDAEATKHLIQSIEDLYP